MSLSDLLVEAVNKGFTKEERKDVLRVALDAYAEFDERHPYRNPLHSIEYEVQRNEQRKEYIEGKTRQYMQNKIDEWQKQ